MKDLVKAQAQSLSLTGAQPKSPIELMALAVQSGADVGTLERIRDLIEWNEKREAKRAYDDALAAFQAECPTLKRTVAGAQGRYRFTPLDHIIEQVRPLMERHGLSRRFTTEQVNPTTVRVSVIITHKTGHSETSSVDIPVDKRNNLMSDPQQVGGAITFAQRYALQLALGIVTAGDDRDGQGPEPKTRLERLAAAAPASVSEPDAATKPVDEEAEWKAAAKTLWELLKPVRGTAQNWGTAIAWMIDEGLIGDEVVAIKQLSTGQLNAVAKAVRDSGSISS
jgi:hypothetical protein